MERAKQFSVRILAVSARGADLTSTERFGRSWTRVRPSPPFEERQRGCAKWDAARVAE